MKPKLIIEQKITPITNKYVIYAANESGEKGEKIAFAQQKRLAFKEKVQFYKDESKDQLAFTMRAEKAMDIHGKFIVEDENGKEIGVFKKQFKQSLVKSTWVILHKDEIVLTFSESNAFLAVIRRFIDFVPIVGEFAAPILALMKYHFVVTEANQQPIGAYTKTTFIRDNYTLSMNDASYDKQDWRVLAALSVALDALQSR